MMASEVQFVEPDILDGSSASVAGLKENGLILKPVPDNASGEGLPYAPVDWPNPGDVWRWKVGKRKNTSGFMTDRYLYPPLRLRNSINSMNKKNPCFASLQSVKEFVQKEFPGADHDALFASFSWKVPSKGHCGEKDLYFERSGSELHSGMKCKALNKMCILQLEAKGSSLPVMDCDICCNESGFCRDCCCILCSRKIDWAYGGYSFIRCEATVNDINICGHAAHIDCALRSYMAGTVGGSIGLDVEYYCRRCDKRTDLVTHVTMLLKTCESLDSRDGIEKVLEMALCILRGSQRDTAKRLLNRIELVLTKLKSGSHLKEIWNEEDNTTISSVDTSQVNDVDKWIVAHELEEWALKLPSEKRSELPEHADLFPYSASEIAYNPDLKGQKPQRKITAMSGAMADLGNDDKYSHEPNNTPERSQQPVYITSSYQIESLKLDDEIEQVLEDLRRSQELEYRMAKDKLNAQKQLLIALDQQLDAGRAKLANHTDNVDSLLNNILRVNQIKQELVRLKDMEEVAKGFGKTSPSILREYFGFYIYD